MIEKHTEQQLQPIEIIDKITCNQCGTQISNFKEYIHISNSFGYKSGYDMQTHSFDLCEQCYAKIINNFIIPVDIRDDLF